MPNGKTHFITGTVVGATVNFIIQSAEMAMDYDRKFDWGEFFLCAGAGAFTAMAPDIGPRLCRRPVADMWNRETVRNLRQPLAPNLLQLLPDVLEPATGPKHCRFFRSIIAAELVAYAISGQYRSKFSRATRLFLWAFCISYLSHIALDGTTPHRSNLISRSLSVTYSNL